MTDRSIGIGAVLTDEQIKAALKAACMHSTPESRKDMRRAIAAALGIYNDKLRLVTVTEHGRSESIPMHTGATNRLISQ